MYDVKVRKFAQANFEAGERLDQIGFDLTIPKLTLLRWKRKDNWKRKRTRKGKVNDV